MQAALKKDLSKVIATLGTVGTKIVEETRAINKDGDLHTKIRNFDDVRHAVDQIKEVREALAELSDTLSREVIPEAMREEGIKTVTIIDVGRVTISSRYSASIIEGKKAEAFTWLRQSGNGSLIQETVNAGTLSAFAKNLLEENGRELPSDMFKTGSMAYTSITKAK